jgi:signal transduction histidine kinase
MQRINRLLACFFFLIISGCANCFAQQYPFVHYTPKDGLVNSRVKKAYQDSKGRMYFLTYGGLSVYDGARFRNYNTQNGLPINIVNDILEIGDDSLLVATNSNHLSLLVKGIIKPFIPENNISPLVNQFYRHDDGRIFLTSDYGLYLLEKNKIFELDVSTLAGYGLNQPNLENIAGLGNFLVITTNEMEFYKGLYVFDIKNNRFCDALPYRNGFLLGKDGKNRIWINSDGALMIVDSNELKQGKILLMAPDLGYLQVKNYATTNVALGKDRIWLVRKNEENRNTEIHRVLENGTVFRMGLPVQVATSNINYLFIDRENSIWICNDGEGVYKVIKSSLQVFENTLDQLTLGPVSHAYYDDDVTWYSTSTKKLFRKSRNRLMEFTSNLGQAPHIFYESWNKILGRDHRNIYESYFTDKSNTLRFRKIISLPDSDYLAQKLLVDAYGAIITSQYSGVGVWYDNKLIYQIPVHKNDNIEDLYIDENNWLWVVRRSSGIEVFSFHPENISNYLQPILRFPKEQILGSVRSFVIDKKGLIWIGTREHGLAGYTRKGNQLKLVYHFHEGNGLSDNFVTTLACDSLNNIIAGTQTGLDRILHEAENRYRVENLSSNNNFFAFITETWADANLAYALTNTGTLLQISPAVSENINLSPELLLEEVKVNGKAVLIKKINFNYLENNLAFLVAAPSFINEKQVAFSYLLEGSGNMRWSDTSFAHSVINLVNLPPGKYVLKVKAFFPSFIYPPSELSYPFEITPPWWQTWWFRSLAILLMIGFIFIVLRFYYRRKMEKKMAFLERQQAIEKERTRIATDMHDDLGAGLSRIKFLSEMISIKKQQHQPVEEEISKIREYSHEMIDKMGEIVWALNEKNDTLSDLLAYTRAYTVEYLSQNGIDCKVETPDHFPADFVSGEFRRNIFLTIKEALHNVVKHSKATEVQFSISINHQLAIRLKDNGTGFDKNKIRQFSNGLANMENRIRAIGGSIEFINENGTVIKIIIPVYQ